MDAAARAAHHRCVVLTGIARVVAVGLVLVLPIVAACGSPTVTAPAQTIAITAPPSATAPASASLRPISVRDIGPEDWQLITTDTNARTAILGPVKFSFGYVFTCTGVGDVTVTLYASTEKMAQAAASPTMAMSWTSQCPTTTIGTNASGAYDGGVYSISPSVEYPGGITYELLVATLPK